MEYMETLEKRMEIDDGKKEKFFSPFCLFEAPKKPIFWSFLWKKSFFRMFFRRKMVLREPSSSFFLIAPLIQSSYPIN